jgi:NTE family protein
MSTHKKKLLGLALSSGGVLGFAHIGVLRALEEMNVEVGLLSGASMGALVAVLNAAGLDSNAIEAIALKYGAQAALLLEPLAAVDRVTGPSRLRVALRKQLPVTVFEALQKPVCIAATDVQTGEAVIYDKGEIWGPLFGSFCIPGVFPVAKAGDRYLLDGSMSLPVPVTELRKRGAAKVIAVSLYDPIQDDEYRPSLNIRRLLGRALNLMFNNLAQVELAKADLVILPDLRGCAPSDVHGYIERGYDATMSHRDAIEALVV